MGGNDECDWNEIRSRSSSINQLVKKPMIFSRCQVLTSAISNSRSSIPLVVHDSERLGPLFIAAGYPRYKTVDSFDISCITLKGEMQRFRQVMTIKGMTSANTMRGEPDHMPRPMIHVQSLNRQASATGPAFVARGGGSPTFRW